MLPYVACAFLPATRGSIFRAHRMIRCELSGDRCLFHKQSHNVSRRQNVGLAASGDRSRCGTIVPTSVPQHHFERKRALGQTTARHLLLSSAPAAAGALPRRRRASVLHKMRIQRHQQVQHRLSRKPAIRSSLRKYGRHQEQHAAFSIDRIVFGYVVKPDAEYRIGSDQ